MFIFTISTQTLNALASSSRLYDFNNTSNLTNFFNIDGEGHSTNINYAGINLSGSVDISTEYEDICTSKTGYITTGTGAGKVRHTETCSHCNGNDKTCNTCNGRGVEVTEVFCYECEGKGGYWDNSNPD